MTLGSVAVDIFFVISGYVMVSVTQGRFRSGPQARRFLWHRLTRIYPLYWVYAMLALGVFLVRPEWINASQGGHVSVLAESIMTRGRSPLDALALLLAGGADIGDEVSGMLDAGDDFVDGGDGLFDDGAAGLHMADRATQHAAPDREVHLEVVEAQDFRSRRIDLGGAALGLGRQEMLRVAVLRMVEDVGDRAMLDDAALGHDADPVGHLAHDAEVVGDEEQGHAVARLQALQQFQDLRLNGDVEGGRRLVGNQQVGFVGERHGDHHALALAAG